MYKKILVVAVMLLVSVVLTPGGSDVSQAVEKKEASKTRPAQGTEVKKVFDAHDTGVRYHFTDTDMDFNFGTLVLGSAVNHGVEIGESFYTVSKIKDGDAASWQQEWFAMAQLAEARGEESLASGHR
ncbi:MAG: hypothetical protein PHD01_15475, partial [Geobacteraceae bacterium]|nr:hypothetical protein [Geobacteraceae bacterium]